MNLRIKEYSPGAIDNGIFVIRVEQEKDNFDYLKSCDFETALTDYLELITIEEYEIHLECMPQHLGAISTVTV